MWVRGRPLICPSTVEAWVITCPGLVKNNRRASGTKAGNKVWVSISEPKNRHRPGRPFSTRHKIRYRFPRSSSARENPSQRIVASDGHPCSCPDPKRHRPDRPRPKGP